MDQPKGVLPPAEHPLLASYLEGIARARTSADPELSLRLIGTAREMGMRSPWLGDNEARALVDLGRRKEAVVIWEELTCHEDKAVAEMAKEMLLLQMSNEQHESLLYQRHQLEGLLALCRNSEWAPSHLRPLVESETLLRREEVEKGLLEEVIATRTVGQVALSLQLIVTARQIGMDSPWLRDNEARALVNLGRRGEALAIWEELEGADDETLAAMARGLAERQRTMIESERRQRQRLQLDALKRVTSQQAWQAVHLDELEGRIEDVSAEGLLEAVLQEVIDIREAGRADLSVLLITTAQEQGINSPWLRDNQARALVNIGQREEALLIWQELANAGDANLAAMAATMVVRIERALHREELIGEADRACREGRHEDAIRELSTALTDEPEEAALRSALHRAIEQRFQANSDRIEADLLDHLVEVEMHESFLTRMEERLQS